MYREQQEKMTFNQWRIDQKIFRESRNHDAEKKCSKMDTLLQKSISCFTKKDKNYEAKMRQLRNEINSLELAITGTQEYNTNVQVEHNNNVRSISQKQSELMQLGNDIKRLESQEKELMEEFANHRAVLKRQHEALLISTGYFKEKMQCYIQLDNQKSEEFVVAFFSKERRDAFDYFVRIKYEAEKQRWMLLDMGPKLACQPLLAKKLTDTADIQGFLFHVRKLFQEHIKAKA